jgi:hypothetical protein
MKAIQIISSMCIVLLGLISCSKSSNRNTQISLISENDTLHFVQIKTDSSIAKWELPYPVFQFQIGDIDNNGSDDILVGVIKKTRFDSTLSKRIFIFKNYNGLIRPLWLGSRLGQPLVDFTFVKVEEEARIRSLEIERSGTYLVAEYKWQKFGLEFIRYLNREIDYKEALALLNE